MKRRMYSALIIVLVLVWLTNALSLPLVAQQTMRDLTINYVEVERKSNLRSDVKAYLTVIDFNGAPINGLEKGNFTLAEDGKAITDFTVQKAVEGLWIVLVVDTTTSMGEAGLKAAKDAADQFVASMSSGDQVALYTFQEEPQLLADFTYDHNKVRNAIQQLTLVDKWTCLYDASNEAVKKAMQIQRGRRAVVLLTDGRDDRNGKPCSTATMDDVMALSWNQRIPLYLIGLGKAVDEAVLKRMAEKTGGAYWAAPEPEDLQAAYQQVSELLQGQYLISYQSEGAAGDHTLGIQADYRGQKALDGVTFLIPPFPDELIPTRTLVPGATVKPGGTLVPEGEKEKGGLPSLMILVPVALGLLAIALVAVSRLRKRSPAKFEEETPQFAPLEMGQSLGADQAPTEYMPPAIEEEPTREVSEEPLAQPLAKLTVVTSLQLPEGESYELYGRSVYIGRGTDNDIVVPDSPVSRAHAELRYQGGDFYVYDRGSRFGTRVNGASVPPNGLKLSDGDELELGTRTTLRFSRMQATRGGGSDRIQGVGSDTTTDLEADGRTKDLG